MSETVKVLRVILYTGSREAVEQTVSTSIHGSKVFSRNLTVSAFSLNEFPEKLFQVEKHYTFNKDLAIE